jgi:hypothetical protein
VIHEEREFSQNPYAASQVQLPVIADLEESRGPEGIGGWLILPLLGLIFTPIRALAALVREQIPVFTQGHFSTLSDPDFVGYHPLWAPLLIIEPIFTFVLGAMAIWALVLMWGKAKAFPRFMVVFYSVNLFYALIDTVLGFQIPQVAEHLAPQLVGQMVGAVIGAAIWIPYMRVSKRVKNTFVN